MDTLSLRTETVSPAEASATARVLIKRLDGLIDAQGHDSDRLGVVAALGLLIHREPSVLSTAVDAGALRILTATLRTLKPTRLQRVAAATTFLLVHDSAQARDAAVRAGIFPVLIAWLSISANLSANILALMVLHVIVADNETHRVALLQAGLFKPLYTLLRDGYGVERTYARLLLAALVAHNDAAHAIAQLDALHAGVHLPVTLSSPATTDLWDAPAFAYNVLTWFVDTQDRMDPEAELARLVDILRQSSTSEVSTLLAFEDLLARILNAPGVVRSAGASLEENVVSACLDRLRGGSETSEPYASYILMNLVGQNSSLCGAVLNDGADGLDMLVDTLSKGKHSAIFVVGTLAETNFGGATTRAVVAAGAIPCVVHVLCTGRPNERVMAAYALGALVRQDPAAQMEALDAGAMAGCLALLSHSGHAYDVKRNLLVALRDLIDGNDAARDAFVDAGGAVVVSELVMRREGSGAVAAIAADAIMSLIGGHARTQDALTQTGVVTVLIEQLARPLGIEAAAAASALSALATGHAGNKTTIINGLAVGRIVELLRTGSSRAKFFAAATIYYVTKDRDGAAPAQAAFASAIDPLVQLLHESSELDMPLIAMGALQSLVHENPDNQATAVQSDAIAPLVDLLRNGPSRFANTVAATLAFVSGTRTVSKLDSEDPVKTVNELVTLLVDMLATPVLRLQDKSCLALVLVEYVSNELALQTVAVEAGALETLVTLSQVDDTQSERFVQALASLITQGNASRAVSTGAVGVLVGSLDNASPHQSVFKALLRLVDASEPEIIGSLLVAGVFPRLGRLLAQQKSSQDVIALLGSLVIKSTAAASACWDSQIVTTVVSLVEHSSGDSLAMVLCVVFKLLIDDLTTQWMAALLPIDVLLRVLHSDEGRQTKAMALCTVLLLTENDDAQRAHIVDAGATSALIAILREEPLKCQSSAYLDMLGYLVGESRVDIDISTIEFVRSIMDDPDAELKKHAAAALASIAAVQDDAISWGVLDPLVEMLQCSESGEDDRGVAAAALACLVDGHMHNQTAVAAADTISRLVALVQDATEKLASSTDDEENARDGQRYAARALANLVRLHPGNAMSAVRSGAVPWLVETVRTSRRVNNRLEGVRALRYLVETGVNMSVADEGFVVTAMVDAGSISVLEEVLLVEDLDVQTTRDARVVLSFLVEKPPPPMAMRSAHVACVPRCD